MPADDRIPEHVDRRSGQSLGRHWPVHHREFPYRIILHLCAVLTIHPVQALARESALDLSPSRTSAAVERTHSAASEHPTLETGDPWVSPRGDVYVPLRDPTADTYRLGLFIPGRLARVLADDDAEMPGLVDL